MSRTKYIWQLAGWPAFSWDSAALLTRLGQVRKAQGALFAVARQIGIEVEPELLAEVLIDDAATTAAIEGEQLDRESIRSSVARRLALPTAGLPKPQQSVDGLVAMLTDATAHHHRPLTAKRVQGWQAALFPTGFSGFTRIRVGAWRKSSEPMRVISGPIGREKTHFEAPPAKRVAAEMRALFTWWRGRSHELDGLLRAGLAHLWFVTIHPFDDGNGRVARAITDMALAQDDGTQHRLYSMSAQIFEERNDYYRVLEQTQKGSLSVTSWLTWFLECLGRSMQRSQGAVARAIAKARFWQTHTETLLNPRQRKVINRLLDAGPGGFEGGLSNRKYVALTRVSRETAKRDLAELVACRILVRRPGGGRSVSYELVWK